MNNRGVSKIIWIIIIIIVLVAAVYFTFFFSYKCSDLACFQAHQEVCSRTKFVNDAEDVTWAYYIKGKENGECKIEVKVLNVKTGSIDKASLNGKLMTCYLTLGSTVSPEADLAKCHGILKEELQNMIINKLHAYIIENVGEISGELQKVI